MKNAKKRVGNVKPRKKNAAKWNSLVWPRNAKPKKRNNSHKTRRHDPRVIWKPPVDLAVHPLVAVMFPRPNAEVLALVAVALRIEEALLVVAAALVVAEIGMRVVVDTIDATVMAEEAAIVEEIAVVEIAAEEIAAEETVVEAEAMEIAEMVIAVVIGVLAAVVAQQVAVATIVVGSVEKASILVLVTRRGCQGYSYTRIPLSIAFP